MPPLAALPDEEFLMSCSIIDPRGETNMTDRNYYVYIMSNNAGTSYLVVTFFVIPSEGV